MQLDLFPSDRPDALIFTTATRRDFERISDLLRHCHARFILDLRELPSLAFERANRDRFFELLTKHGVTYEHLEGLLGAKLANRSISVVLEQLATGTQMPPSDQLKDQLRRLIENGPTLVFTDTSPETDGAATFLAKSLENSKIKFSPVFTAEERQEA